MTTASRYCTAAGSSPRHFMRWYSVSYDRMYRLGGKLARDIAADPDMDEDVIQARAQDFFAAIKDCATYLSAWQFQELLSEAEAKD